MAYSSPSSSRICSTCSGTSSSCFCSSCECSDQLTVSQNSSEATPTCSCNSFSLSNFRSSFNSVEANEMITNEFQSLDGSIQRCDVDDVDSVDDNTTLMESVNEENRIEEFDTFIVNVKTENNSEEEQEAQTEELFVNEEIPDGVILGQEEIWIPPAQSQDMENVFAMENSVPYEFVHFSSKVFLVLIFFFFLGQHYPTLLHTTEDYF